jgi:hypothetical protein
MQYLSLILLIWLSLSCNKPAKEVDHSGATNDPIQPIQDTTTPGDDYLAKKYTVLVLPPYDEIAHAGISPPVHEYLEDELSKDSTLSLIKFPFKDLMNVPYHNVYDKKYCKAILEKVPADVVVMSKIDQSKSTGNMAIDTWNLSLKIYYPKTERQFDSKITFTALTDEQIKKSIYLQTKDLVSEIQAN